MDFVEEGIDVEIQMGGLEDSSLMVRYLWQVPLRGLCGAGVSGGPR